MADVNQEFMQNLRRALAAIASESRPVPEPGAVTEVTVRVGSAEGVRTLSGAAAEPRWSETLCGNGGIKVGEILEGLHFPDEIEELIQRLLETRGVTRAQLLGDLLSAALVRLLSEAIRDFAGRQGPDRPGAGTQSPEAT